MRFTIRTLMRYHKDHGCAMFGTFLLRGPIRLPQRSPGEGRPQIYQVIDLPSYGSGIMADSGGLAGLVGGFDDPSVFAPTVEIYCSSAQPWVHAGGARKQFQKMPS